MKKMKISQFLGLNCMFSHLSVLIHGEDVWIQDNKYKYNVNSVWLLRKNFSNQNNKTLFHEKPKQCSEDHDETVVTFLNPIPLP